MTKLKKYLGDAGAGLDSYSGEGGNRLYKLLEALVTEVEDMRAKYESHAHRGGIQNPLGDYNTSPPQVEAGDVPVGTPSTVEALVEVE